MNIINNLHNRQEDILFFIFGREAINLLRNKTKFYRENCALMVAQDKARVYLFDYNAININDLLRQYSDYSCYRSIEKIDYNYFLKYQDKLSSDEVISNLKKLIL